ncbi:MAG: nucleotidyltransferase family protein, partial [Clostridium sp.]
KYPIKDLLSTPPNYIRPLAFNSNGAKFLKKVKNIGEVDIVTNVPKHHNHPHLDLDILGTKAYSILNPNISPNEDYLRKPFVLK